MAWQTDFGYDPGGVYAGTFGFPWVMGPMTQTTRKVYVIGSLRNPQVPEVSKELRAAGFEVFDDWFAAGPEADDYWQRYEKAKGNDMRAALGGHAATHVFEFDKRHLDAADMVVLVLPAGKSGHLELGYSLGRGKPGYILMPEEPERFDVMYKFATGIALSTEELVKMLKEKA